MRHSVWRTAAIAGVIAVAAATTLAGCTPTASSSAKTLTIGMTADINGWTPGQPSYQGWPLQAVYDELFRCDAKGDPQPDMAESFKFAADNTSVTIKVRKNMKFSDGEAADAKAIVAAVNYTITAANSRLATWKVTQPDADTVKIELPESNPLIKLYLCNFVIPSPKAIATAAKTKNWTTPIGSGPYTLDKKGTTTGSVYSFTKNNDYWDAATFPYQKLIVKVLKSDTAAINALKTGQIEGVLLSSNTLKEAQSTSSIDVLRLKAPNTTRLLITDHLGKVIPALGQLKVRQAINMVFDRDSMAKDLYQGNATPAYQIFKPGSDAYINDLKNPYPYDVNKAKQLMTEAGYGDGFSIQIPVISGGGNIDLLLPYVTQQLALINIKVEPVALSGPNMYSDLLGGKYPMPLWQLGNYGASLQDISDYVLKPGIWNVEHQDDATIDGLWAKIVAGEDVAKNEQAINQYTIDQAWFVPMVYADNFYGHSKSVKVPEVTDFTGLNPQLWDFK